MSYIRCPECANYIGLYVEFIQAAKAAIYKERVFQGDTADYVPEKIDLSPDLAPCLKELFDALKINNRCCRTHLLGYTNSNPVYT